MLYIQGGFRQRPEKSEGLRTMTFSWKIFQTEGTSSKKVLKQAKKCLTYLRKSQKPLWREKSGERWGQRGDGGRGDQMLQDTEDRFESFSSYSEGDGIPLGFLIPES